MPWNWKGNFLPSRQLSKTADQKSEGSGDVRLRSPTSREEHVSPRGASDGPLETSLRVGLPDGGGHIRGLAWFQHYPKMSKQLLRKNRVILRDNGDIKTFRDHMLRDGIFTPDEIETIEAEKTRHGKMSRCLDMLERKTDELIQTFVLTLRQADRVLFDHLEWPRPSSCDDRLLFPTHPSNTDVLSNSCKEKVFDIQREFDHWYIEILSKLHPLPECKFFQQDLDDTFTNLKIVEGRKHEFSKRGEAKNLTIDSIQKLTGELWGAPGRTVTFVEGPAGIGKSTLCRRLAYLWSTQDHAIHGRPFHLVLLLEARGMIGDLKSCIAQQLLPNSFKLDSDTICKCIDECGENCLFIVDGVDELSLEGEAQLQSFLKGKVFRHANWLVTGRPEATDKFIQFAHKHLKITGFTADNIKSFITKYFSEKTPEARDKLLASLKKYHNLRELAVNPFTTLLLCVLVEENRGEIPYKHTDILEEVIQTMCKRYTRKLENSPSSAVWGVENLLHAAGQVAYAGFRADRQLDPLFFTERDVKEICGDLLGEHLLRSGLLIRDVTVSRLRTEDCCYFPHKSFQEFLCARHLVSLNNADMKLSLDALPRSYFRCRDIFRCLLNLSDDQSKLYTVVAYLIQCLFSKGSRSFGFTAHMAMQDIYEIKSKVNLVSLSAEIICKDEQLSKQMCMNMVPDIERDPDTPASPYSRLEHSLLRQPNTLAPVVVAAMESGQQMDFERRDAHKGILHLRQSYLSRDLSKDCTLTATMLSLYTHEKLLHYYAGRFKRLPVLTLPWVHCDSAEAAIAVLQDDVIIRVISVWLLPGHVTVSKLDTLFECLKTRNPPTKAVLFSVTHPHADRSLYTGTPGGFSPDTGRNTPVQYCSITSHHHAAVHPKYPRVFSYEFLTSPQEMYYERFCPY